MLIKCKECGKEISDKALNCPSCGSPVKEFVNCNYCGFYNLKTSKFCVECGASLECDTDDLKCKYCDDGIIGKDGYCEKCGRSREDLLIKPNIFLQSKTEKKKEKPLWIRILKWFIYIYLFLFLVSSCSEESTDLTDTSVQQSLENDTKALETEFQETETQEELTEVAEAEQVPTFEEYSAECQEFKYKDVLRSPNDYIGKKAKIEIEISSVHEESLLNADKYYLGYSKDEEYDMYMGDYYGIFDNRYDTSLKLLEGDVIMVYGEIIEPEYTSSIIVNSEKLFCIDMKFVELISE